MPVRFVELVKRDTGKFYVCEGSDLLAQIDLKKCDGLRMTTTKLDGALLQAPLRIAQGTGKGLKVGATAVTDERLRASDGSVFTQLVLQVPQDSSISRGKSNGSSSRLTGV
ncbi:hypothetical protein AK812_SmicGene11447 [Symbiodinium microadriaticum]|uniref:Uncharacterized protein n=1 Tax=Symbiodinium microadriaticum TaxID=2951 RepID=A0A1Q9ED57_SYMMI|nr:hypothetical protein AK812_SmicGene11447 [Symbiodinium microadriaticum]